MMSWIGTEGNEETGATKASSCGKERDWLEVMEPISVNLSSSRATRTVLSSNFECK